MKNIWYKHLLLPLAFLLTLGGLAVANDYYTHGGYPATGSAGSSAAMRAELDLITAGFDKLPVFASNANKAVIINSGATGMTTTAGTFALAGNFAITGAFNTTLVQGATTTLTLPLVNGTLATIGGTETLTGKTINLTSNTLTGTTAQFNTALSDNDFATLAGAESLTNKTIASPVFSGTATGSLTNLALTTPALTGAVTGTYTLGAAATLSSPVLAGTPTGSWTSPAFTSAVLTTSTVAADPSAALGIASKQYVDAQVSVTSVSTTNPIINGNMEVWQRGTSFATAADLTVAADRFRWNTVGTGVVTLRQSTNVPSVASAGVLFNYSLEVDVTTADASLAATDFYGVWTKIEGGDWRHFAQRQITISFWVSSTKTGIHCVSLSNGVDRDYVAEYTVNVADTWEQKTLTITASPSSGTWNYTTSTGLRLLWTLGAGSNFQQTAGSWLSATGARTTSNQVNVVDNAANFFRITGIKMELGAVATPITFAPFATELARAKRYYQKSFPYAVVPIQNVGDIDGAISYAAGKAGTNTEYSPAFFRPVTMRITPNATFYSPFVASANAYDSVASASCTSPAFYYGTPDSFGFQCTGAAGTAVGNLISIHYVFDAEL